MVVGLWNATDTMSSGTDAIDDRTNVRIAVDGMRTARAIIVTASAKSPAMSCIGSGCAAMAASPNPASSKLVPSRHPEHAQRPGPESRNAPEGGHHQRGQEVKDVGLVDERRQDREPAARDEHEVDDGEEAEREQKDRLAEQRESRLNEGRARPGIEAGTHEHRAGGGRDAVGHGAHRRASEARTRRPSVLRRARRPTSGMEAATLSPDG